jgi:hypothetical protein
VTKRLTRFSPFFFSPPLIRLPLSGVAGLMINTGTRPCKRERAQAYNKHEWRKWRYSFSDLRTWSLSVVSSLLKSYTSRSSAGWQIVERDSTQR